MGLQKMNKYTKRVIIPCRVVMHGCQRGVQVYYLGLIWGGRVQVGFWGVQFDAPSRFNFISCNIPCEAQHVAQASIERGEHIALEKSIKISFANSVKGLLHFVLSNALCHD